MPTGREAVRREAHSRPAAKSSARYPGTNADNSITPKRRPLLRHYSRAEPDREARLRRAAARRARGLAVRRFRLGEEPAWDQRQELTIDQRLALVLELTLEQWRLAGTPIPDFEWRDAPGGLRRLCDDAPGQR